MSALVVSLVAFNSPASPVDRALAALCDDGTELACVSVAIRLDAAHKGKTPSAKVLTVLEDATDPAAVVVRGLHYLRFDRFKMAAEAFESACDQDLSACAWSVAAAKRSKRGDPAALVSAAEARCAELEGAPCAELKPLFSAGDGAAVAKIMATHYANKCRKAGTDCDSLAGLGLRNGDAASLLLACRGQNSVTQSDDCVVEWNVALSPADFVSDKGGTHSEDGCRYVAARSADGDLNACSVVAANAAGDAKELMRLRTEESIQVGPVIAIACRGGDTAACAEACRTNEMDGLPYERTINACKASCKQRGGTYCSSLVVVCGSFPEGACKGAETLVKLEVDNAVARGETALKKKNPKAAVEAFAAALAIENDHVAALGGVGRAGLLAKNYFLARLAFKRALDNAAGDAKEAGPLYYDLGRVEEALGNWSAAVEAYTESLENRPNHADTKARLKAAEARATP